MTSKGGILKKDWLLILMLAASFGVAAYFYPFLPERVPTHWNIYGEVDGYSSRFFGAFGLPLLNVAMYAMMLVTPYIDPKKANYRLFEGSYRMFRVLMSVFLVGMQLVVLAVALGYNLDVGLIVKLGVSVLLIMTGNVMGRFKYNYFVGIKNPWTLASEEVWRKTHRMAAPVWVSGGVLCLVVSLWNNALSAAVFFITIMVMALIPSVYSYFEYRRQVEKN